MNSLNRVDWEILNATADDCENLEQLYRQLCFEVHECSQGSGRSTYALCAVPDAPSLAEIAKQIDDLVKRGLLAACADEGNPWDDLEDASYLWRAWFRMTPQGRIVWEAGADNSLEVGDYLAQLSDYEERLARGEIQWR
jgi:hypothetical protein